jgi:hypothetical protein
MVTRAVAAAAVIGIAVTGCGSGDSDEAAPDGKATSDAPVSPEVLSWSEEFCGHVTASGAALEVPESAEENPETARQNLLDFLGSLSEQLTTLGGHLRTTGAPPVDGGSDLLENAMTSLTGAGTGITAAQESLEQAEINDDPEAFADAMAQATEELQGTEAYEGPAADFRENPELDEAFNALTACQEV